MGAPKLSLPFGPELMLERVTRLLASVVSPLVVVAAPGQKLPPLPRDVLVARDDREGRGPLEGLAAGWSAMPKEVDAVYATSCDVPLLRPAFVRRMIELLGDHDIAVPVSGGYHHPLAAVYRRSALSHVRELLAADRLRPLFLFEMSRTREVQPEELVDIDPDLESLENLNHPEDYFRALARAGFEAPPEIKRMLASIPRS
jgi:molybdopterin-guanine dinucleotide biosynthesis protein A